MAVSEGPYLGSATWILPSASTAQTQWKPQSTRRGEGETRGAHWVTSQPERPGCRYDGGQNRLGWGSRDHRHHDEACPKGRDGQSER